MFAAFDPDPKMCSVEVVTHNNNKMLWYTIMHEPLVLTNIGSIPHIKSLKDILYENRKIYDIEIFREKIRFQKFMSMNLCPDVLTEILLQFR